VKGGKAQRKRFNINPKRKRGKTKFTRSELRGKNRLTQHTRVGKKKKG